jgi:hypothetical protein
MVSMLQLQTKNETTQLKIQSEMESKEEDRGTPVIAIADK